MLPGFNSNDQFMAIEGFTNSFHNRSDEAFTVSDLEEFQAANNIELPSVSNNTVNKKPQNKTGLSKQNIDDEVNSEEELNDNELNTTTTRPASAKTTTTRPASARTTTTRPASAKTTTTRPASARTTTTNKMPASNVDEETEEDEYFKDLNPETNDTNTTEMEDPEMEETDTINEINEDIETPTEEENIESEMNEKLSENTGKDNSVMEGFTGSRLIDEKWLNTLLKSLLLTFMVYVLIHPSTGKVLTKFFSKSGLIRDLIASGIFFVVCYIVIMVF